MTMLTMAEAAAILNFSYETVRRYVADGTIPAIKTPKGRVRINAADLEGCMEDWACRGPAKTRAFSNGADENVGTSGTVKSDFRLTRRIERRRNDA